MSEIFRPVTIKGLSDERRLPRLGVIRKGERRKTQGGKEYPVALDHFKFDDSSIEEFPEIAAVYADPETGTLEPRVLRVLLPVEDTSVVFPQALKLYGASRLVCKGDGERARRFVCSSCGEMRCKHQSELVEQMRDCPCELRGRECKPVGSLMVMLPDVSMEGVWQVDTSSINSIIAINSGLGMVRGLAGRISGVPLKLTLRPQTAQVEGRSKTIHVLRLGLDLTAAEVRALRDRDDARLAASGVRLIEPPARDALPGPVEPPHDEGDELPAVPDEPDPPDDSWADAAADADPSAPFRRDELLEAIRQHLHRRGKAGVAQAQAVCEQIGIPWGDMRDVPEADLAKLWDAVKEPKA